MLKILEQARLEAMAGRSPVSARFIQVFIDHGTYDPQENCYYLAGATVRSKVWKGREDKKARNCLNRPSVIIAKTVVGKGVDFLEGQLSHNLTFPQEIAKKALISLENYYE